MQAIKPTTGGSLATDPEINIANYPAIKFAMNINSFDPNNPRLLTDLITGSVQGINNVIALSDNKLIPPLTWINVAANTDGNVPGPTTTDIVLLFYIGGMESSGVKAVIGQADKGPGLQMTLGSGTFFTQDDGGAPFSNTYHNGADPTRNLFVDYGVSAAVVDLANNNSWQYTFDSTGYEKVTTISKFLDIGSQDWGAFGVAQLMVLPNRTSGNNDFYGLYMFYVSTLPTDLEMQRYLGWMHGNPGRLHPSLLGLT